MAVYTNPIIDQELSPKAIFYLDNKCAIFTCNGSPEGVILASIGSIAHSDNGSIYKKTTDDINTGWVELTGGTISSPFVISGTNPTLSFVDTDVGDDDGSISMQSDIMSLGVVPGTQIQINNLGQILGYARNLSVNSTAVGTVGAGLDNLHSFVLPAGSLRADGDYLKIIQGGFFANNGNTKRVQTTIDGQIIFNSALFSFSSGDWSIATEIIRISVTTVRVTCRAILGQIASVSAATVVVAGGGAVLGARRQGLTVANLVTNPVTILAQGEGTADNDVVQDSSIIELIQR